MADRFEQLKMKYQSVLNFIQSNSIQLQNLNMEGDKLLIRATARRSKFLLRSHCGHSGPGSSRGSSRRRSFHSRGAHLHSSGRR
jgi:hypothetical protein